MTTRLSIEEIVAQADRRCLPADADLEGMITAILEARCTPIYTPKSSFSHYVGYDPEARICEVAIRQDNRIMRYCNIPPEMWTALRQAKSKGKFFRAAIFGGPFFGIRIAGDPPRPRAPRCRRPPKEKGYDPHPRAVP